jgi:hypothetical protein
VEPVIERAILEYVTLRLSDIANNRSWASRNLGDKLSWDETSKWFALYAGVSNLD